VGITEEADAVVVVVSEETASISVVMAGEMTRDLDAPRLRVVLRDLLTRGEREPETAEKPVEEIAEQVPSEGKGAPGAAGAVGTR
jgi:diadenylate cyclase